MNEQLPAGGKLEVVDRRSAARKVVAAVLAPFLPFSFSSRAEAQEAPHPLVARAKELTGSELRKDVKALRSDTGTVAACESADEVLQKNKDDVKTVVEFLAKAYEQSKFPFTLSIALPVVFTITAQMKKSNPDREIPTNMNEVIAQLRKQIDSGKHIDCAPEKLSKYDSFKGALQTALAPIASSLITVIAKETDSKKTEERIEARKAADALLRLLEAAK